MSSQMHVHLFGPGSILRTREPQGKTTVSGELKAKQRQKRSAFLFGVRPRSGRGPVTARRPLLFQAELFRSVGHREVQEGGDLCHVWFIRLRRDTLQLAAERNSTAAAP